MQFNFVDFVVALACSKTSEPVFVSIICLFLCVGWSQLKRNLSTIARVRVIKITLVCVAIMYSHFRISVNCSNHFD